MAVMRQEASQKKANMLWGFFLGLGAPVGSLVLRMLLDGEHRFVVF